jgi:hypothetical protein
MGVLVLAGLAAAWFFSNFDYLPETRWEKPGKEALRNPYLAFERLLERLGRPVERVSDALALDRLAPGGVLLLDNSRRIHVNARRVEALFDWVERGGYLIVAAEPRQIDDPVLKRLGIKWYQPPKAATRENGDAGQDNGETGQDETDACESSNPPCERGTDVIQVHLPARGQPLSLRRSSRWSLWGLAPTSPVPVWKAGAVDSASAVLHYDYGAGRITVFDGFDFLVNRQIGEYDHAELIWTLIRHYQPRGEVHLATRLEVPTLWEWLAESAWMVLVSGALLIAAWLWKIVPRFGGTLASPNLARRSLVEHLAAVGRAVWHLGENGRIHWDSVVRQELRRHALQRHPHLAGASEPELVRILSAASGVPENRVAAVLAAPDNPSPRHFVDCAHTAQQLEQRL